MGATLYYVIDHETAGRPAKSGHEPGPAAAWAPQREAFAMLGQ